MKFFSVLSLTLSALLLAASAMAATITVNITAGTNATSHRIEKKIGAGTYATLVTLTMPTVSYVDSAVSEGNIYSYRAVSINTLGESAPSAECTSALIQAGPPSVSCTVSP